MSDDGWEERMAARARARSDRAELAAMDRLPGRSPPDRSTWPVPDEIKGYSGRDVFLWYIIDGWNRILGGNPRVVFDHDFGLHVLSDGTWQLKLASLAQFPDEKWPEPADGEPAGT